MGREEIGEKPIIIKKHRMKNYAVILGSMVIVGMMLSVAVQTTSAIPSYDYRISGSQVLGPTGTVVYSGSDFSRALTWATGQANKVTYVPAGNYVINTAIYPAAGITLIGDGDGPTGTVFNFNDPALTAEQFVVYNVNGITFSNFRMTGYGSIEVYASRQDVTSITFDHVTGYRCGGNDYVFGLVAASPYKVNGVTFTNCHAEGADAFGFLLTGSGLKTNVVFTDCTANYCGYYSTRFNEWTAGFDVCELGSASKITLTRCTATYNLEAGFHLEYAPLETEILFVNCVANYNGQKAAGTVNSDGTVGTQYGVGFLFKPTNVPNISFSGCSGTGNTLGLSRLAPGASTLSTVPTIHWKPTFTNSPATTGKIGVAYSYTPTVNESSTLSSVAKPSWASWSGTSMTGTPATAGSYTFSIKATSNSGTLSSWKNWTVTVPTVVVPKTWAPTFTNSPATTGKIGVAYSYTPTVNESSTLSSVAKPSWASWSGTVMSGSPPTAGSYSFSIKAVSTSGTLSSWKNWTVSVPTVVTHWKPTFTNSPATTGTIGSVYSYTPTVNESSTLSLVTKPSWASWSGTTMTGTPTTAGSYTFSIKATSNSGTLSSWKNWTVTVPTVVVPKTWAPTFTNSPATTGKVGVAYSYAPMVNESSTLSLVAKPSWASWSGSVMSGTPAVAGSSSFSVKATSNSGTLSSWKNWTVSVPTVVVPKTWASTFTNSPSTTGMIGSVYSYTPTVNESSTLSSVTKPSWASWSGTAMSGTPTTAGSYSFSVKAVSTSGTLSSWKNWTVTVPTVVVPKTWAPTFTNTPATVGKIGSSYSYVPTVNESSSLTLVSKPSWASWSGTTMTGTPTTAGSYAFSVKATSNSGTLTSWKNWTVTVPTVVVPKTWAPTFTNSPATTGKIGVVYSYTPKVNESSSLLLVSKPSWAKWSGTTMTGTPTTAGSYSFSVKATSTSGTLTSVKSWTVTIPALEPAHWAPKFIKNPATTGKVWVTYSYTPTVNESSTLSSVAKPSWASWSGKVISGTPTAPGSYSFSVKATSVAGDLSSWQNWTVTISSSHSSWNNWNHHHYNNHLMARKV